MNDPEFNGADYQPDRDKERLVAQNARVLHCMKDGEWRTLGAIGEITGDPQASISAQLRHLRKKSHGSHEVNKRYIKNGLYKYQVLINEKGANDD